ncbi:MarR family winged helix-turn-helix transcriptional regulator [Brevundimonas lenta]|uniref:DNA-binding MarR family transcriptional regulator n=1 Tax=Brevundimonas lenta TaxID=424796 RepID=A0A7W6NRD6_9CAUL|nr:MarR family transcriptional regulator [Brevundimonas lenta]MBB4084065.1 DNA-binding MarR family transcriptional regulator [Brevundimonas lenta]
MSEPDPIDERRAQWAKELPDVDTGGMDVLGRARRAVLASRPAIEGVFARHGLDTGEFDVVSTLLRSGPPYALRPTELFRSLMISSGGLTDRLNRLQKAGLISRPPSPEDRRSLLVQLTDEGRARAEAAFREDMAVETRLLEALSEDDEAALAALLRKLSASIAAGTENADTEG